MRGVAGALCVAVLLFALVGPARAASDDFEVSVPVGTFLRGIDPGTVVLLTDPPVQSPGDLVGRDCTVVARSQNQQSTHPNNDLVVETGTSQVRIEDVESAPGATTNASGRVTLGADVTVSLIMGPDGTFSAGVDVTIDCAPDATTTTQASTTTTEISGSEVTTTLASTTTTTVTDSSTTTTESSTTTDGGPEPSTTEGPTTTGEPTTTEELLPYTGPDDDGRMGLFALALVAVGLMLVVGGRTMGDLPVPWGARCGECGRDAEFSTPHGKLCMTHTRKALNEDSELWVPTRIQSSSPSAWRLS